jgi:hypothetical protein
MSGVSAFVREVVDRGMLSPQTHRRHDESRGIRAEPIGKGLRLGHSSLLAFIGVKAGLDQRPAILDGLLVGPFGRPNTPNQLPRRGSVGQQLSGAEHTAN